MSYKKEAYDSEGRGLRLIKKGKKGILRMVFSRTGIILLLLLFNVALLAAAFIWFEEFLPQFYGGTAIFTVGMVIYLINSRMDPSAKVTWLIIIMLLPVFGSLLYLYTRLELGHRAMRKRLKKIYEMSQVSNVPHYAIAELEKQDSGASALAKYVSNFTGIPASQNTKVTYFPIGEKMFEQMLKELRKAEKSIYLEFFIVDEGVMWGEVLEILAEKASQGIDIKLMYDGACELLLLPKSYPKKLKELGIDCRVFSPATPFLSTHYNYRDHRKILTVDGKVAFTGGVNLADEYINLKPRFGHWKDTGVMLSGDAVLSFERMFLQIWHLNDKKLAFPELQAEVCEDETGDGFVLPYYEDPLDGEHIGRQVYIDILNRAQKYVHIMTPYLILDGELECALTYAAKRGVDVRIVLPGIPDKKIPYALAKTHYPELVEAGVKVYEYIPGFVHAKVVVADNREAVVGSINFDYRSLYHHFECAAYLYGTACISDIVEDFNSTVEKCKEITPQTIKKEKLFYKVVGRLMKAIAPLM